FSKSFWTSEFIFFEMNSRLSSVLRPGAISVNTSSGKNRVARKSFFMTYSIYFLRPSRLRPTDPAQKSVFLWQGKVKPTLFEIGNPHARESGVKFSEQAFHSV